MTNDEIETIDNELEDALLRADTAWLTQHFASDAMFVHADGRIDTGHELIARVRVGAVRSLARRTSELAVRRYGDAAVVTGRLEVTVIVDGRERQRDMRYTRVYVRERGRWLFVSHQGGANDFSRPREIQISPSSR